MKPRAAIIGAAFSGLSFGKLLHLQGIGNAILAEAGIKAIAAGDLYDGHVLPVMGDATLLRGVGKNEREDRRQGGGKARAAIKDMKIDSLRGPITIASQTRDVIQPFYIRKAEKAGNALYNIEFDKFRNAKDPGK